MKIQQVGDWFQLVDPINDLYDFQESLKKEIEILKDLAVSLDDRLKALELKEVRRENLAKARAAK